MLIWRLFSTNLNVIKIICDVKKKKILTALFQELIGPNEQKNHEGHRRSEVHYQPP